MFIDIQPLRISPPSSVVPRLAVRGPFRVIAGSLVKINPPPDDIVNAWLTCDLALVHYADISYNDSSIHQMEDRWKLREM